MAATYPADTFQEGVDLTIEASNQLAQVVRGDANTEVMVTDGSTIPSIRKAQADSMYFKEPEAWTTGQTETDYLQLKKYTNPTTGKESWWFAKGAMVSNPVAMGTSPFGDDNWTLYTPEDLFISGKAEYESIYQALKGKAAEAGYNLVRGSFEEGGTLTNTKDVLWYQATGKYYSWAGTFPKVVAAGSTPATTGGVGAGAWVDRTDVTLRSDLASENGSRLVGYQPAGTGAVTTNVQSKLRESVSVKDFGAVGDGVTDDTAAIQAAIAASQGMVIIFPTGVYKITSRLDFRNAGIEGDSERGSVSSFGGVEFASYVAGDYALTVNSYRGQSYRKFTVKSYAANQSGMCVLGDHPVVDQVRIEGFDKVSFRVGTGSQSTIVPHPTGVAATGCYYAKIDNLFIVNSTVTGSNALRGVFNDGGFPSSNANTYRNVVVNGRFDILYQINGTNNSLYGGDCDPNTTVAVPTAAYKIGGINIKIHEPYYELGFPTYLYWFDANSFACEVSGIHMQGSTTYGGVNYNTYSKILDEGWANNVAYLPVGYNYKFPQKNESKQNLIANSHFRSWNPAGLYGACPHNWIVNGGTWSQDSSVVRGAAFSVTATAAASTFNLAFTIASPNTNRNSPKQFTLDDLRGRTLVAAVWCKSSVAGLGNIKISGTTVGSTGTDHHTGSGNWELLTCIGKIDAAATDISIELRNANSGSSTGQCWFSEPVCFIGVDLTKEEPRPLTDDIAQMFGPMFLSPFQLVPDLSATPDVQQGNCFTLTNSGATTITNLTGVTNRRNGQIVYLLPTNANTTLANNSNIQTTTGANKALSANVIYKLIHNGSKWYEF